MTEYELYHHGVKGMKWGVRRYQNPDGSLTDAGQKRLVKSLNKDYKRNYESARPFKTSESYKKKLGDTITKNITDADKKRITDAKNKWLAKSKEIQKAEDELYELAGQYGKKVYDDELRKNPKLYDTPRSREKLFEYCKYEDGVAEAEKRRPDLVKTINSGNKEYDVYKEECRKVSDKILGSYGDTKLYECKYYSYSIRDTVGDMINSMESQNWKT